MDVKEPLGGYLMNVETNHLLDVSIHSTAELKEEEYNNSTYFVDDSTGIRLLESTSENLR